jgi:hypothetical protein
MLMVKVLSTRGHEIMAEMEVSKNKLPFCGWIGRASQFLCNRQNHARRDRRGLFSIHTKHGLLNRRPKKASVFNFDLGFCTGR